MNELLTDWLSGTVRPVRCGVYQRLLNPDLAPIFALWDGVHWRLGKSTIALAAQEQMLSSIQLTPKWRGVVR